MKDYLLRGMFVLASLIPTFGCSPTPSVVIQPLPLPVESENRSGVALNDLPAWNNYRVDPYIQAVAKLQSLGKEGAGKALVALAVEPDSTERELKVLLLCRLLFAKKPGQEFRSPMLGIPVVIGESAENAWPLEPFEVVDGIPLRITRDYQLGGAQEHPVQLLLGYSDAAVDNAELDLGCVEP